MRQAIGWLTRAFALGLVSSLCLAGAAWADGPSGSTECALADDDCDGAVDEDTGAAADDNDGDGLVDEDTGTAADDNDGDGRVDEDSPGDTNGDGNLDDDLDGLV